MAASCMYFLKGARDAGASVMSAHGTERTPAALSLVSASDPKRTQHDDNLSEPCAL